MALLPALNPCSPRTCVMHLVPVTFAIYVHPFSFGSPGGSMRPGLHRSGPRSQCTGQRHEDNRKQMDLTYMQKIGKPLLETLHF